jgi:beta-fructofuranosidase
MEGIGGGQLAQARKIEEKGMAGVPEDSRPRYHVSSPVGWMNDPNGFSYYEGEYHLFFQYHPFSNAWGPMHWGHCKSRDFIRWEYLPLALAPDQEYDAGGCYSGSALEADGEHVLVYTGVIDRYLKDGTHDYRQVQCIAKGNGVDYEKYEGNPVLDGQGLPEGCSQEDFRDPKVWKEGEKYYMAVGNRTADGDGQALLYRSDDLKQWEFLCILDQSMGEYGKMWECPDFFPLGEKHVLLVSPQDMRAQGYEFHNGNNSVFLSGHYEESTYKFQREGARAADYGLDFYAPQTVMAPDGRRIMVGWMQSWDAKFMGGLLKWSGMMTIPRELSMRDGRVYQNPVRELEGYRKNLVEYTGEKINGTVSFPGISGRVIDLQVEITEFAFHHFAIRFAKNEEYEMLLQYNRQRNCLTIDRTHSGLVRDVVCRRKMETRPLLLEGREVLKLRILLDQYSAEVFVNDGERVMTSLFPTPMEADGIVFDTDGEACMDVRKYDICI